MAKVLEIVERQLGERCCDSGVRPRIAAREADRLAPGHPDTLAATALQIVNSSAITTLMVVDGGRPVGIVHLHDLLRIGVA